MGRNQSFRCIECSSTRQDDVEMVSEFACLACDEIHRRIDVIPFENVDAYLRTAEEIAQTTGVKVVEARVAPGRMHDLFAALLAKPGLHNDDDEDVAGHA